MSEKTQKIILYPREYNKRGEANLHSVMGVSHDGEMINVKLRISDDYQGAKSLPSIQELSRTDRKAKSPAIASPDNSPESPEGIILFTGAIYEKTDKTRGIKHYIASWAHVIREDSDAASPHIGIGRIKVKTESSTARMIKNKLKQNITEGERQELIDRLDSPKSYEYSAIFYAPEIQIAIGLDDSLENRLKEHEDYFSNYFSRGIAFGYYAIICDKEMNPIPNMSKELLSQYSPITGDIDSPSDFSKKLISDVGEKLKSHGGLILIPCYKLNPTNNAKNYYAMPDRLKMIQDVFHTPEGHARANTIVSRTVNLPGGRGVLFEKSHPLRYEKYNLDLLDCTAKETRVYSSKMTLDYNNSKIDSIRIGIIDHGTYLSITHSLDTPGTISNQDSALEKQSEDHKGQSTSFNDSNTDEETYIEEMSPNESPSGENINGPAEQPKERRSNIENSCEVSDEDGESPSQDFNEKKATSIESSQETKTDDACQDEVDGDEVPADGASSEINPSNRAENKKSGKPKASLGVAAFMKKRT